MKKIVFIVLTLLLLQGAKCGNEGVFPGNMGQVADAAVVDCDAYQNKESEGHKCLVLASSFPEQGFLRIFDITDNQFILSPIAYFPLAVHAGQTPIKLAANQKISDKIFVLDNKTKNVHAIATKNGVNTSSFQSVRNGSGYAFTSNPAFIASITTDKTASTEIKNILVGIKNGKLSTMEVYDLDKSEFSTINWASSLDNNYVNDSVVDQTFVNNLNNAILYVATDKGISRYNFNDNQVSDWSVPASIGKVIIGRANIKLASDTSDGVPRTIVMGLSQKSNKAFIYIINNDGNLHNQNPYEVELGGIPFAGYIHVEKEKCCGNNYAGAWGAALLSTGSLQYIKLQKVVDYYEAKVTSGRDSVDLAKDFVSNPVIIAEKVGISAYKTGGAIKMFGVKVNQIDKVSEKLQEVNKILLVFSDLIAYINAGDDSVFTRIDAN